jgi:hypothetical protein
VAEPSFALPGQLWRWWRLRSRRGYLVAGALPSPAANEFVERLKHGAIVPLPFDAERPDDADVVVIVGRVSMKLRPHLATLSERLPPGAVVVAVDDDSPLQAGTLPAQDVLSVDVQVLGLPPSLAALQALVARLVPNRERGRQ